MKKLTFLLYWIVGGLLTSAQTNKIATGIWRGEMKRTDGKNIVVNLEVVTVNKKTVVYILNAGNRLEVDNIVYAGDSVFMKLPFFDSQFRLALNGKDLLSGTWRKTLADRDVVMPFLAVNNKPYRFLLKSSKKPALAEGRWAVKFFDTVTQRQTISVGIFEQNGNQVTGSFLMPSGDYRYLQGVVDGDSLKLSGFDGGYALLFEAKIDNDSSISRGAFFSGAGPATKVWSAVRDKNAKLRDAATAARVKEGIEPRLDFTFRDTDGKELSIRDSRFKNKVIVVQLLGSWCPNCLDETRFLVEVYKEYKSKGVEIVGLAYERTTDFSRSQQAVRNFSKRLGVNYPILIPPVAVSDPDKSKKTLPQLENIPSFPTSIFIGRDGRIAAIHAGFNGPATGTIEYQKQTEEFYHILNGLL